MKNPCKQEFADSDSDELCFVNMRPLLSIDDAAGSFPPVRRPIHADKIVHAFESSQTGVRSSVIVLEKALVEDPAAYINWTQINSKYFAARVKHEVIPIENCPYIGTHAQLYGEVCLDLPGKLRNADNEWLFDTLERVQEFRDQAGELGLIPLFSPSLAGCCSLFGQYCVAPFGAISAKWQAIEPAAVRETAGVKTFLRLLYWLIAGINLFDRSNEEAVPLLSKWTPSISLRNAEILRAFLVRPDEEQQFAELLAEMGSGPSVVKEVKTSSNSGQRGLNRLAGLANVKHMLQREMVAAFRDPETFKGYGLKALTGLLLLGPSGCGKTLLARSLAEELNMLLIQVRPADVASMYVRETLVRLREFFDQAAKNKPCILFFDEFDSLVPDRNNLAPFLDYKIEEVNEIITQLDRARDEGIIVIAASNQPFNMDPAVFRAGRFDRIVYMGPPGEDDRSEILRHFMHARPTVADIDLSQLSPRLEGYSVADLKLLVEEAARLAFFLGKAPISAAMLSEALTRVPPSISVEVERRFEKFIAGGYA